MNPEHPETWTGNHFAMFFSSRNPTTPKPKKARFSKDQHRILEMAKEDKSNRDLDNKEWFEDD